MCEQSGYFVTDGHYLEASYKKSADILKLHKDIIAAVSSFRLNPGTPFEESYFAPYTEEQRKNAEETGYDLANNLYRPHITLARYKSERAPTDLPNLPGESLSFKLDTVSVFRADENGSARELIKTYHLLK
jgi:hypothetical protein